MDEAGSSISETSTLSENVTENGAQSKPTTDKSAGNGREREKLLEKRLRRQVLFSDLTISYIIEALRGEDNPELKIELMSSIEKIEELGNELRGLQDLEESRAYEDRVLAKLEKVCFRVSPEEWRRSFLGIS